MLKTCEAWQQMYSKFITVLRYITSTHIYTYSKTNQQYTSKPTVSSRHNLPHYLLEIVLGNTDIRIRQATYHIR